MNTDYVCYYSRTILHINIARGKEPAGVVICASSACVITAFISYLRSNHRPQVLKCLDPPACLPAASSSSGPWRRHAVGRPEHSAVSFAVLWISCSGTRPETKQALLSADLITSVKFVIYMHPFSVHQSLKLYRSSQISQKATNHVAVRVRFRWDRHKNICEAQLTITYGPTSTISRWSSAVNALCYKVCPALNSHN